MARILHAIAVLPVAKSSNCVPLIYNGRQGREYISVKKIMFLFSVLSLYRWMINTVIVQAIRRYNSVKVNTAFDTHTGASGCHTQI